MQASGSATAKYSQDSGAAWSSLTLPASTTFGFRCWCGNGNLIYYINQETMTVYVSLDGGLTWKTRGTIAIDADFIGVATASIACHDNMLYVLTMTSADDLVGGTGMSVWYSSDGGATFTETIVVNVALGYGYNADLAVLANGTVIAMCKNHGAGLANTVFFKSTDSGATFSTASTISSKTFVWLATDGDGTNLVATGSSGMQVSTDTAATWTSISTTAHGAAVAYGDNMLSNTATTLRKSANNGVTWTDSDTIAVSTSTAHALAAWSGGFAILSGATKVMTSTGTSSFAAVATSPAITPIILYAIEEV